MKNIYKQAWDDYLKLIEFVREFKGTLEQLCKHLNGWNLDSLNDKFDCNFGTLTATVCFVNGEFFVENYLDIWDDKNYCLVQQSIDYTELKKIAEDREG